MTNNKVTQKDIQELKTMLTALNLDLKRILGQSAKINNEAILAGLQKDYSTVIVDQVTEDIEESLERTMTQSCDERETCKTILDGFLQKNASLIKQKSVDSAIIIKNRAELQQIKQNNTSKQECAKCFNEASNLFEKQVQIMQSLQIYNTSDDDKKSINVISEEALVSDLLEPLSNVQRLQILKAVAVKTTTFSEFAQLTNLRGGNLLFHIQKLLDSDMILQRHERGDYMITEKGYKVLKGITQTFITTKT